MSVVKIQAIEIAPAFAFIQELTDTQFDDLQDVPDHYIVFFYAPWCTHCVEFLEEYNTLAESMAEETKLLNGKKNSYGHKHDYVKYFYLNCEKYGEICRLPELNIQSYPAAVAFNFKFKGSLLPDSLAEDSF
jgi:thiol-disulfide isomerase/thioredoxin